MCRLNYNFFCRYFTWSEHVKFLRVFLIRINEGQTRLHNCSEECTADWQRAQWLWWGGGEGKQCCCTTLHIQYTCQHHRWLSCFWAQPSGKPNLSADEKMHKQMLSQSHTAFLFTKYWRNVNENENVLITFLLMGICCTGLKEGLDVVTHVDIIFLYSIYSL